MDTIEYLRQQAARYRSLARETFGFEVRRRLFDLIEEFEEKAEEIIQRQGQRERSLEWSALIALMADSVIFLCEADTELRDIATIAPEMAAKLRRMAEELEEEADELARARRDLLGRAGAPCPQGRGNGKALWQRSGVDSQTTAAGTEAGPRLFQGQVRAKRG